MTKIDQLPENYRITVQHLTKKLSREWYGVDGRAEDPGRPTGTVATWHVMMTPVAQCSTCHQTWERGPWFKGHGESYDAAIAEATDRARDYWKQREDFGPNGDATTPGFMKG